MVFNEIRKENGIGATNNGAVEDETPVVGGLEQSPHVVPESTRGAKLLEIIHDVLELEGFNLDTASFEDESTAAETVIRIRPNVWNAEAAQRLATNFTEPWMKATVDNEDRSIVISQTAVPEAV